MEYKLISAPYLAELNDAVNKALSDGWFVHGTPLYATAHFCQAVVRPTENEGIDIDDDRFYRLGANDILQLIKSLAKYESSIYESSIVWALCGLAEEWIDREVPATEYIDEIKQEVILRLNIKEY